MDYNRGLNFAEETNSVSTKARATTGRHHAKDKEKDKITEAKQGKLAVSHLNFARLGFDAASDRYLGHIDPDMTRRYSHPRRAARRAAVAAISVVKAPPTLQTKPSEGGYVTNHVTKPLSEGVEASYPVESNGRDGQI